MVVAVCILTSGCERYEDHLKESLTIWKTEVRSPDGSWIASAETIQNGGFGSAAIQTTVYLKQATVSGPPMEVLDFWCDGPAPRPYVLDNTANAGGTIHLAMNWVTPSHLDVTYDGNARLDFQAIKMDGIDISVRNLSTKTTASSRE
jgi:hypothetical protein